MKVSLTCDCGATHRGASDEETLDDPIECSCGAAYAVTATRLRVAESN